jgi:hypothetical protein
MTRCATGAMGRIKTLARAVSFIFVMSMYATIANIAINYIQTIGTTKELSITDSTNYY